MQLEKIQNNAPKIPELVMQTILRAIDDGRIQLNEDLPSERDLAAALGVGRGSLRECLAILEFLGVITSRSNRKVVVKTSDYIQNALSLLRLTEDRDIMPDLMEFRRVNECAIVKLACERATEEDIAELKECLDRMERDPGDVEADIHFHLGLAKATHNALFDATLRLVNSLIRDLRFRFFARSGFHQKTLNAHRAIFEAVARRDKAAAKAAMLDHLLTTDLYAEEEDVTEPVEQSDAH